MSTEELEIEALKLTPQERARLAERLLESLENLSEEENAKLWAEEAERRNQGWDANPSIRRAAGDVFRDANVRLK
jgi:putative addiction module component (TIGR02574 family)